MEKRQQRYAIAMALALAAKTAALKARAMRLTDEDRIGLAIRALAWSADDMADIREAILMFLENTEAPEKHIAAGQILLDALGRLERLKPVMSDLADIEAAFKDARVELDTA